MIPVSVILPTYNEAENILGMIEDISEILGEATYEIIVVDDDSPDGTSALVRDAADTKSRLRLITRRSDRGLIPSIREGVAAARHDICVWLDADQSMKAEAIPRLLAEIEGGADLAIGSRYIEGGGVKGSNGVTKALMPIRKHLQNTGDSFLQVVLSIVGNWCLRHLLTPAVTDYTSGYYAVRKDMVEDLGLEGTYVDYCIRLAYTAWVRGYAIREVPVVIYPRLGGESKTATSLSGLFAISFGCMWTAFALKMNSKKIRAAKSA